MKRLALGVAFVLGACGSDFVPLTVDELTTACLRMEACSASGTGINACFGGDYTLAMRLVPSTIRCLAQSTPDCASVGRCLGESELVGSCDLQFGFQPQCIGDRISICNPNSGQRYSFECSTDGVYAGGPTCIPPDDDGTGIAACGLGRCDRVAERWCDGDVVRICNGSLVLEEYDCARRGMTCESGGCTAPGGGGSCVEYLSACVGHRVRTCATIPRTGTLLMEDFRRDTFIDCPTLIAGSTCHEGLRPESTTPLAYCGFGEECQEGVDHETCDGTTLRYCAAGVFRTIDCTSLGYSTCQAWWPDLTGPYGGRCRL